MDVWNLDLWSTGLFAGAALLAVTALVRLMRRRRDEVTAELRRQVEVEDRRLRDEKKRSEKKKAVV